MIKKKIRIMHVAQAAGGVDRYLKCLIKYLDHEKFENILVCSQDFKEEDYKEIVDYFVQVNMRRSIRKEDFIATSTVRKLIKKYNPDIVYAHSSKAGAIVRMANIGLKPKCVYNPHGWSFNMRESKKKQMAYAILERIMAPFCDKIVCISDAEKESGLKKHICARNKLNVIFNGVDIQAYEECKHNDVTRASIGIPEDALVVGMTGRLSAQKAPDTFLKMATRIKKQIPNAHFLLVGNGEMQEKLEQYARKQGMLESVHITGWINNPLSYVKLFDVAVLLSRWEGFGLAIPEYMMCQKPVVATAVDAIPNIIIDHVNGILVPMDDPSAACDAVMEIFSDLDLKNKLIAQGSKDVHEKYDARRVSEEHGVLFEKLCR